MPDQHSQARRTASVTPFRAISRGFTLVELMIVVGVLSILMIIAIPNFIRFRARSRQSEAKLILKGIFKAKKAVFAEQSIYRTEFAQFGFERNTVYTYRAGSAVHQSTAGSTSTQTQGGNCAAAEVDPTDGIAGGFTINAAGNIDSDAFVDGWYIDDHNCLHNGGCCTGCGNCTANLNDALY